MLEWMRLAVEVLPALLGLLLAAYVAIRVYGSRSQFFKVARGQILTLSMGALVVLWASELAASGSSGFLADLNLVVGLAFVVFTIWLSTVLVSMAALYPNLNSARDLHAWLRGKPFNFVTGWGAVGLSILVFWPLWSAYRSQPLLEADWILVPVAAYLLLSMTFDVAAPIIATRLGRLKRLTREGKANMMLLATAWMGIPSAEFALDIVPEMALGFEGNSPYSWLMVLLFAVISRSIHSAGFLGLVISPEVETLMRDGFRPFDIPRGVYLVYDSKPDTAFSLFSELCTLPLRPDAEIPSEESSPKRTLEFLIPNGLVVTREFPDTVRAAFGLQVTPIIWLAESPGERRVAPTSLTALSDTITRFMEASQNGIVLLEGMEYLVTHNGFRKVLKLLDSLNEATWVSKARLLVAADPNAFDDKDLALLERDRTVVWRAEGIEELKRESMVAAAFE